VRLTLCLTGPAQSTEGTMRNHLAALGLMPLLDGGFPAMFSLFFLTLNFILPASILLFQNFDSALHSF